MSLQLREHNFFKELVRTFVVQLISKIKLRKIWNLKKNERVEMFSRQPIGLNKANGI